MCRTAYSRPGGQHGQKRQSHSRGPAYARAFLVSGTQRMPNFNLNETELDAIVAYLEFVDTTGRYPAGVYEIHWYGTVVQSDE